MISVEETWKYRMMVFTASPYSEKCTIAITNKTRPFVFSLRVISFCVASSLAEFEVSFL